jgi:hypothetical protein
VLDAGLFVDLLVIDPDDLTFSLVCGRARWVGRDALAQRVVRLHRDPIDWLAAGCAGSCHVALISRKGLRELRSAEQILCDDVHTALEAWDWGFGANDKALSRFEVDAESWNIRDYFRTTASHRAVSALHKLVRAA